MPAPAPGRRSLRQASPAWSEIRVALFDAQRDQPLERTLRKLRVGLLPLRSFPAPGLLRNQERLDAVLIGDPDAGDDELLAPVQRGGAPRRSHPPALPCRPVPLSRSVAELPPSIPGGILVGSQGRGLAPGTATCSGPENTARMAVAHYALRPARGGRLKKEVTARLRGDAPSCPVYPSRCAGRVPESFAPYQKTMYRAIVAATTPRPA